MIRLCVWANARPMGWFGHEGAAFFFEYDAQWLILPGAFVLAPQFPLAPGPYTGVLVRNFFENLLPESEALEDVVSALHLRSALTSMCSAGWGRRWRVCCHCCPPMRTPNTISNTCHCHTRY